MTRVEIFRKNGRIVGYKATGHSDYAEYGEDIVCAALSMALQMPLGGMQDVLELIPKFDIDSDGYLRVDMRGMDNKGKERELDTLLESMALMVKNLSKEYPKNVKLVEKEEK